MSQTRYKITLEYDGARFEGWQKQPSGKTVQDALEKALSTRLQEQVRALEEINTQVITTQGAGRTDTGVHALGQVAHCDLPTMSQAEKKRVCHSLNRMLAKEKIFIHSIEETSPDFHARYSAYGKYYVYRISKQPKALLSNFCYYYRKPIDIDRLQEAAALLEGRHDFKGLANENSRGSASFDSVRTIWKVAVIPMGDFMELHFVGEGFLYKMVRNCTSLLLDIASGKREMSCIEEAFQSGKRPKLLYCAPPQGLTLIQVLYTEEDKNTLIKTIDLMKSSSQSHPLPSLYG